MTIALLHTADLHRPTFDRLLAERSYAGVVRHVVREDLLARARAEGVESVTTETIALLQELAAAADVVVCTCSTLGPLADQVAAETPHVLRIDRPVMEAALALGPAPLVAFCLESTRAPTLDVLTSCAAKGQEIAPRALLCAGAWARFEAGDMDGYAARIAEAIRAEITARGRPDCILLAQASMQGAAAHLADLGLEVLTSPPLAADRAVAMARLRAS